MSDGTVKILDGNTFVDCQREISLGLIERTPNDHTGGIVRNNFIYRGVRLTGFMLGRHLAKRNAQKIREIYADLGGQVMAGRLAAPVDTVYPIDKIREALAHADKGGRNGKILVSPNGAI